MKHMKIISILAVLAILAAACQGAPTATQSPTTDPALILTAAAQTAAVRLTQMVAQTPSATPTSTTPTPDLAQTAAVETVMAQLTATAAAASPTPTFTVTPETPVQTGGLDRAEFVGETIPDGTVFAPGATFKKSWKLKNAGTSTWTTQYALVFVQGDKIGAPDKVQLSKNVVPGETIDITVDMVAPTSPRSYRGYWRMLNPSGKFFDDSVYVDIVVGAATSVTPTPSGTPGTPAALAITNATMVVDTAVYSGTCPHTLTFTAQFTASGPGLITYQLQAQSSTPGFTFSLPAATTMNVVAGNYILPFSLEMKSTVVGSLALQITSPVSVTSSPANFSVTCAP